MRLITELFIHRQLPEGIIVTCLNSLFDDINEKSIEILCQMLTKISNNVIQRYMKELHDIAEIKSVSASKQARLRKPISSCEINLEFVRTSLNKLFAHRHSEQVSQRCRFKIQDVMDVYSANWKEVLEEYEESKKMYVP